MFKVINDDMLTIKKKAKPENFKKCLFSVFCFSLNIAQGKNDMDYTLLRLVIKVNGFEVINSELLATKKQNLGISNENITYILCSTSVTTFHREHMTMTLHRYGSL